MQVKHCFGRKDLLGQHPENLQLMLLFEKRVTLHSAHMCADYMRL